MTRWLDSRIRCGGTIPAGTAVTSNTSRNYGVCVVVSTSHALLPAAFLSAGYSIVRYTPHAVHRISKLGPLTAGTQSQTRVALDKYVN